MNSDGLIDCNKCSSIRTCEKIDAINTVTDSGDVTHTILTMPCCSAVVNTELFGFTPHLSTDYYHY